MNKWQVPSWTEYCTTATCSCSRGQVTAWENPD